MEIKDKVLQLVADCLELPVEKLSLESGMDDLDGWDSMRNVMILSRLEDDFNVMIPEDDIFDLVTIGAIVDEIEKLKA